MRHWDTHGTEDFQLRRVWWSNSTSSLNQGLVCRACGDFSDEVAILYIFDELWAYNKNL